MLEDGRTFRGRAFGAVGETFGEAVFATAMSGYQETLTDPSYHRQVVVATAPHIGNTGWNDEDDESGRIWVAGYVVRDAARVPSNWRSRRSLDDELKAQGIVGMSDIDTRALTRHLRERGAMRVGVSSVETDPEALRQRVLAAPEMTGAFLADQVSTERDLRRRRPDGERRFRVVAVDLGIKAMTPHRMAERGIEVHVVPATATFDEIAALEPDGIFFSNGPGDPGATEGPVQLLRGRAGRRDPVLRDLLRQPALRPRARLRHLQAGLRPPRHQPAGDGPAYPQGRDHRAQPRLRGRRTAGGRDDDPVRVARVSHVGLNDQVVEGLELRDESGRVLGFSVQYHPEAAAGPHDAAYLFDRFVDVMAARAGGRLMPKRTDIKSILVIGSGPIVIGQACEFDYSGTQACRVLRAEGFRVILVNSNPATIMTDPEFADATYIEPITPEFVEQVIALERPDALLATLGGQTALNAAVALHENGALERYGVEMIGASFEAIQRGENREQFKAIVENLTGMPGGPAEVAAQPGLPLDRRRAGRGGRARLSAGRPAQLHHGRGRLRLRPRRDRSAPDRRRRTGRQPDHRGADRGVDPGLEGVRARGDAGPGRQRGDRLLDREPGPDGRAHRRLDHRRPGHDPDRPGVPADARRRDRHHPGRRGGHRGLQHPVRDRPEPTAG